MQADERQPAAHDIRSFLPKAQPVSRAQQSIVKESRKGGATPLNRDGKFKKPKKPKKPRKGTKNAKDHSVGMVSFG